MKQSQLLRASLAILLFAVSLTGCGKSSVASPTSEAAPEATVADQSAAATASAGVPGSPSAQASPVTSASSPAAMSVPTPTPGRPALPPGVTDPSNGPLRTHRLVTFYGHPFSDKMGVLGEYAPNDIVARLKQQAALYTQADPTRPAIPTIELIASVAQGAPGKDGLYLLRTPPDVIEQYARLAEQNGFLLLLDIQIGRSTVADEINALLPFLKRPYVHLAIDPEFAIKPGQTPGEEFGSVDGADILLAARMLADVVTQNGITDKVLLVHQFLPSMITNKQLLKPMPHVELVLNTDGFGPARVKKESYKLLVQDQPVQYGGIKLFYKQDEPLLTPEEVLALVPVPVVVIFQ